MSEEIKTELNEDDVNETVCFHLILEFNQRFAQNPAHARPIPNPFSGG